MTKFLSLFTTALLLSISAHSAGQTVEQTNRPPQLRSASALSGALQQEIYTAVLKPGFHFNDKAPNQVTVDGKAVRPSKLEPQKILFQLPKSMKEAQAILYVCDDQITFCETHHMAIKGTGAEASPIATTKSKSAMDEHGFYNGGLEKAFALAKEKNQLVLLDFTAIWCPGCVRNKSEIFSKPEFKKISKDVVKVKIDVDLYENFAVTEKYKIKGIPTLILLNGDDQEIDRLVDFQTMEKLKSFITSAQKDPTPVQDWMKLDATADSSQQLKAGRRLLAAGKTNESIPFLARVQPTPPELLLATVTAAQEAYEKDEKGQKENYLKVLREALKEEPDSTRSIVWRTELVKLVPKTEEAKTIVAAGVQLSDEWIQDEAKLKKAIATDSIGEFAGFEKWVVAINKADLLEAAEAPEEEQIKAISEAADFGIAYKIPVTRKGPALRQLVMLVSSKRWTEAENYANKLLKADPGNTDVQRRMVKILTSEKKYTEAIKLAEKLMPKVEGRNEFWLAEGLAKAYIAAEKKSEAKKLLTAYLARPEMQAEKMKSSKKTMEDLLKGLQ